MSSTVLTSFLKLTGPVAAHGTLYQQGSVCSASSSSIWFGRFLHSLSERLEGTAQRNGSSQSRRSRFSFWLTRQDAFANWTDRLDRAFDIGTRDQRPAGCTVISDFACGAFGPRVWRNSTPFLEWKFDAE